MKVQNVKDFLAPQIYKIVSKKRLSRRFKKYFIQ